MKLLYPIYLLTKIEFIKVLKNSVSFILFIIILTQTACAQRSTPYFGWNLNYDSLLEENNVGRDEWVWDWLNNTDKYGLDSKFETPAKKWISEWDGEPIISSILTDYPGFHAAEHSTIWFFRTKNKAYYWLNLDVRKLQIQKQEIKLEVYDKLYEQMSEWKQNKPIERDGKDGYDLPGYIGFFSFYDRGKSRQMLLTREDFIGCEIKECGEFRAGRLLDVLVKVMSDEGFA